MQVGSPPFKRFHVVDFVRKVGGKWFLLYAGQHRCIDTSFYFALFALIIAVLVPSLTYFWLFHKSPEERLDANLTALTGHYNAEHWYVVTFAINHVSCTVQVL